MNPEIIKLANELNAANCALKKTINPNRPLDRAAYNNSLKAYRSFWAAVDAQGIKTEDAAKLIN